MKKISLIILALVLLLSMASCSQDVTEQASQSNLEEQASQSVTEESVEQSGMLEITNEEELFAIANNLSGYYVLKNDITLTRTWNTLGTDEHPFEGILDGNGYTIKNMEIQSNVILLDGTSIEYMVGMFGVLDGTVKNLNIDSLKINVDSVRIAQTDYLSMKSSHSEVTDFDIHVGFAGLNKGNIRNVKLNVDYKVIPDCESARIRVGGIAGKSNDEISECIVKGKIKVQNRDGYIRAGGVAGYVASNGIIDKTKSDIEILAEITVGAKLQVGGLVGNLQCGIITDCVSQGSVKAINTESKAALAGGLIGLIDNCDTKYEDMSVTVNNCYSTVDVVSKGEKAYASGFIGQIDFDNKVTVTNNSCSGRADGQKSSFGFMGRIQTVDGTKLGLSDINDEKFNSTIIINNNKSVVSDAFATKVSEIVLP